MTQPSEEIVVRQFFAAMNAQDADAAIALARPDVRIELGPNELAGHDALRSLALQRDDELDAEWTARQLTKEGDELAVEAERVQRWRATGEIAGRDVIPTRFRLDAAGEIEQIRIG